MKCLIFFFTFLNLHAAAPFTHLYLADQWLENFKISREEKTLFLKGSVFPDIRYIAHIPRSRTHRSNITLNDVISEENFFIAGHLLHCYIDETRETMACKSGIYDLIQKVSQGQCALLLKLVEDEFLYENTRALSYQKCFSSLTFEEITTNISKDALHDWNTLLNCYLDERPSQLLITLAQENQFLFGFSPSILYKWSKEIPQLIHHPKVQNYIRNMLKFFTQEFETFQN